MKINKANIIFLVVLVVTSVLYRVSPYRVDGFMPQIALGVFSAFLFRNNKMMAWFIPIVSMFLSDALYHMLYLNGKVSFEGFYGWWQIAQYACVIVACSAGFFIKKYNALQIGLASLAAPALFFIVSNFFVWVEGAGYQHSYTTSGLLSCYIDGIPFYKSSLQSTALFSALIFGTYYLLNYKQLQTAYVKNA